MAKVVLLVVGSTLLSYLTANHWMVSGSFFTTMEYPASRNSATSASFPICATRGARIPYLTGYEKKKRVNCQNGWIIKEFFVSLLVSMGAVCSSSI